MIRAGSDVEVPELIQELSQHQAPHTLIGHHQGLDPLALPVPVHRGPQATGQPGQVPEETGHSRRCVGEEGVLQSRVHTLEVRGEGQEIRVALPSVPEQDQDRPTGVQVAGVVRIGNTPGPRQEGSTKPLHDRP